MGSIPVQLTKNYNMFRNSRYTKEGSSLYLALCGKSILQTCGGGEADQHIENCKECQNEIKKYN